MPNVHDLRTYGGWLELSVPALRHNLAGVVKLTTPATVMAVVKANAYGAGATELAGMLQAEGVSRFAVATVDEAAALREAGIDGEILCLTYFDHGDAEAIRRYDLAVTVFSPASASMLAEIADAQGERRHAWIKIDTGLGRLGVSLGDAATFIEAVNDDARLAIDGVYSTLTENGERDRRQLAALLELRTRLPALSGVLWSIASSHGILTLAGSALDVVRPGIVLLGFPPSEAHRLDAERLAVADPMPVISWKSRVADVKTISAGNQVGYGEQPALEHDTRVATLMTGWADGYHGTHRSDSCVLVAGRRCAVLSLSANTTLVDVTHADSVVAGDEAVLLGRQGDVEISVEELARTGNGVYRMLAGIPARVPRIRTN